jgi:transposase IS116/IS110/IS902 family protein
LQAQVKQSTQAINRLHNLLARVFPELATLTDDIGAGWVLHLLDKYPTAERIGQARLGSLEKIPYLTADQAQALHQAAQQSVGSLRGTVAETLVRDLVAQVRHAEQAEQKMRQLLTTAFADLPASGHRQLVTIPGIGAATAAVLTAKIVDIDRFATPEHLVGYFGVFPDENSSGVDKQGNPLPLGTLRMSQKGNDLARSYLWNAARSAITHNPAVRALYRRLKAKGKRGDVAIGHCMRKLLHLVFAVWKTDQPFDADHFPWEPATTNTPVATETSSQQAATVSPTTNAEAVGHTRAVPDEQVVTTATYSVAPPPAPVNPPPLPLPWHGHALTLRSCAHRSRWNKCWRTSAWWGSYKAVVNNGAGHARCMASPPIARTPSPCIWARMSSNASKRTARCTEMSWTSGPRCIVCRFTTLPSTWPRPFTSNGTEKRIRKMNPSHASLNNSSSCRHHGRRPLTFIGTSSRTYLDATPPPVAAAAATPPAAATPAALPLPLPAAPRADRHPRCRTYPPRPPRAVWTVPMPAPAPRPPRPAAAARRRRAPPPRLLRAATPAAPRSAAGIVQGQCLIEQEYLRINRPRGCVRLASNVSNLANTLPSKVAATFNLWRCPFALFSVSHFL